MGLCETKDVVLRAEMEAPSPEVNVLRTEIVAASEVSVLEPKMSAWLDVIAVLIVATVVDSGLDRFDVDKVDLHIAW